MAFPHKSSADIDAWSPVNFFGGVVQAIAVEPGNPSIVYAGTQLAGIYRTADGGGTWTAVNTGLTNINVLSLVIDPSTPSTLYAGTAGNGVFRSTDAGSTWVSVNDSGDPVDVDLGSASVNALRIDPNNPSTAYAATFGGVYKTSDRGETWEATGRLRDAGVFDIVISRADPKVVFVATQSGGVYRSQTAGANWTQCNGTPDATLGSQNIRALVLTADGSTILAATQGLGVYTAAAASTSDCDPNGTNPLRWSSTGTLTNQNVRVLTLHGSRLMAGTTSGTFSSQLGSNSWTGPDPVLEHVNTLTADSDTATTLYAGTAHGAFKSADSGSTWAPANTGIRSLDITDMAFNPSNASMRFVTTRNSGIARSIDSGITWSFINTGVTDLQSLTVAVAGTSGTVYLGTADQGLFKSETNGDTWINLQQNVGVLEIADLLVDSAIDSTVYAAVTQSGVLVSKDAGITWAQHSVAPGSISITGLKQHPTTPLTLYAYSNEGGVFKSVDGGETWAATSLGLSVLSVQSLVVLANQPETLFAATHGGGIFRSDNGAGKWVLSSTGLSTLNTQSLLVDPTSNKTLYVTTPDAGVYKSTDSGTSWFALDSRSLSSATTALAIDTSTTPPTVYAGTTSLGLMAIQSTVERNQPINPLPEPNNSAENGGGIALDIVLLLMIATLRFQRPGSSRPIHVMEMDSR